MSTQTKKNRQAATAFLISAVEEILPGGGNKEIYESYLATLSDKQFDELMQKFDKGEDRPFIYAPNFKKAKLNVDRNIKLAKKYGHSFFERIWFDSSDPSEPAYLSNNPYMVIELPVRRQAQLLIKKISVPEHNLSVDQMTGQPSGESKASNISYPELQVMRSMSLDQSLQELVKYRGGDIGGFNAMNKAIAKDGAVSLDRIEPYTTGVESTSALKVFLTSMHLKNTL